MQVLSQRTTSVTQYCPTSSEIWLPDYEKGIRAISTLYKEGCQYGCMDTLKIVCCSASEDNRLVERFCAHMRVLELLDVDIWYAHTMLPGAEWERERDRQLQAANLILLLISADFIGSHAHYSKEVLLAMERYDRGEARVIPIILRPVGWQETLLGKLLPLPDNGKPVTDASWKTQDFAFLNIVSGVKRVIDSEKTRLRVQQEHLASTFDPIKPTPITHEACAQLEQIIQNFTFLRAQITSFVRLKGHKGFSLENCESQYNKLYGDTLVFLATYLPECVADDAEGFVETVYRKTNEQLRSRSDVYVLLTRWIISALAKLEKLAEQIDACRATLAFYKQKYFTNLGA
jgi:hypothetical protein